MFAKIIQYLETRMEQNAINPDPFERRQVAAAALLVEASRLDGHYESTEQGTIIRLIKETMNLPSEQARTLFALAEARQANTYDDWIFCQAINRGYSAEEKRDILEKICVVIFSDGKLHRLEAMMLERVSKELGIPKEEADAIRDRVAAKSL